jgi:hypothetical protein
MSKLLAGEALVSRAKELGVALEGGPDASCVGGHQHQADEPELQRRVIEAERSIRESQLWKLAVISALASVFSAVTAVISAITAIIAVAK